MTFLNIDSPVHEIRVRAVASLASKLEKGLLSPREDLLSGDEEKQQHFLSRFIRCWFLRKDVLPSSASALRLLRDLLDFEEVRQSAIDLGIRSVLSRWRLCVLDDELLDLLNDILSNKLPTTHEAADSESETSSENQFMPSSFHSLSPSSESALQIPLCTSLPSHLLLPSRQTSTLSPVRPHYFKKVKFSQSHSLSHPEPPPSFPWIHLTPLDLAALDPPEEASYNSTYTKDLLAHLSHSLFIHFPPQVFLQRPKIIHTLLHVLQTSDNSSVRAWITQAFQVLVDRLHKHLCHGEESLFFLSSQDATTQQDYLSSESSLDDNSLEDRLEALELKKERMNLSDFVWRLFEISLALWNMNDGGEPSLRLVNNLYSLQMDLFTLLGEMGIDIHSKEGGRIHEIGQSLGDLMAYHASRMYCLTFHRLAYLLLLKLDLKWIQLSVSLGYQVPSKMKEHLRESVYDSTLLLSHPRTHADICQQLEDCVSHDFESVLKPLLKSIYHCVNFMKGSSKDKSDIIHSASHAIPCFPLHESHVFLNKFFKLCSDSGDTDLHIPIIQLLKIKNINLKTQIYLSLHSLVQSILGLSHALNKFDPSEKFKFLVSSHQIFENVLKTYLNEDLPHSLRLACEEIILYLLKSEHILKGYWQQIIESVFVPNTIYFESLSSQESRLGRLIFDAFNPDIDLRTITGLSKSQILSSNFRLLYHNSSSLRGAALGNLKVLLAQEENSCLKLPRFAEVFQGDVSNDFIREHKEILNFRGIANSNQSSIGEFIKLMESFLFYEDASSHDLTLLLNRLIVLIEDNVVRSKFVEVGGFNKLIQIWNRILQENDYDCGPEVLPSLLNAVKGLFLKNESLRQNFDSGLLFHLLRSMFILNSPRMSQLNESKKDVSVIAAFILFKDALEVDTEGYIKVDPYVKVNFTLPFHHEVLEEEDNDIQECLESLKGFKLLKVYWNICFEGLTFLSVSSATPNDNFDKRLTLSPDERTMIFTSFPKENFNNPSKLIQSTTPSAFLREMERLVALRHIHDSNEALTMNYDKIFKRFLTLEPTGVADFKVYIKILNFLMDHISKDALTLGSWIKELLKTDSTVLKIFLREIGKERPNYLSLQSIKTLSQFLKLFGIGQRCCSLIIRELRNWDVETNSPNTYWLFLFFKDQVDHYSLLDCCDVSKYILECLKRLCRRNGILDSSTVIELLLTLQRIVEKTLKDMDFESLEIFGRLEWVLPLISHRSLLIRSTIFQILSLTAFSELGADSLIRRLSESVSIWEIGLSTFMNEEEGLLVREGALKTLANLLHPDHKLYYGPTIKENVSGILIKGQSALTSFLSRAHFEEFIIDIVKSFGLMYRTKYEEVLEEDSCSQGLSSSQQSPRSKVMLTPLFMGGVLSFLLQVPLEDPTTLFLTLNSFSGIDLSDSALDPVFSKHEPSDYIFFLDSLICLYRKYSPSEALLPEGLRALSSHLASTLYLRQKMDNNEELDHMTMNTFLWLAHITRDLNTDETAQKLKSIFKKYEEGLLKASIELLKCSRRKQWLPDILAWIIVFMNFTYFYREDMESFDECLVSLKRDIATYVSSLLHSKDQESLDSKSVLQFNYALCSLCLHHDTIGSDISRRWLKSIMSRLSNSLDPPQARSYICLLNNLCQSSMKTKSVVLKDTRLSNVLVQYIHYSETLRLLTTLASSSPEPTLFRSGKLLNEIMGIVSLGKSADNVKKASRILIILSANSPEIRSLIYKSNFLTGESPTSSRILFEGLDPKRKTSKKRSSELILMMDLLLTVTSFSDGQLYVPNKAQEVMDHLLISLSKNRYDILPLAILRNISFHPNNRARMLLCKTFLSILRDILQSATLPKDSSIVEITLQIIWSISHNSLKAKGTLREAGIIESLKDLQVRHDPCAFSNSTLLRNVNQVLGCDK